MKIKNFKFILLVSVILSGLMFAGYFFVHGKEGSFGLRIQNQVQASESYRAASISKETILVLLAVGIIGALGVSRKKRDSISPSQEKETSTPEDHQHLNAGDQGPIAKKL